jgi:hypothetical protein
MPSEEQPWTTVRIIPKKLWALSLAKEMMIETTTLVDGHYQIGLPFKHSPPNLPDSLPTDKKRLQYLKDKMDRNPKFHKKYSKVMKNYVDEGAAREVPEDEVVKLKPLWYLPHHAVWHPIKPEEARVVFDCACKTQGVSLNDELLRGPETLPKKLFPRNFGRCHSRFLRGRPAKVIFRP